ncbi:MAG TPA: DUF177 domain-containing protein [Ignavibacteriaceae bacterium]|nr:DUF177 domain-containing protein [Ignavibacteriaceae bacterium]
MKIKISNLSEGTHNFRFSEPVNVVGLELPFEGNVEVEIELKKTHNQIILDSSVSVSIVFECDRCNGTFKKLLGTGYKMVYLQGMEPVESQSDNIVYIPSVADVIDISDDVRDFSILAVPMKKLCSEECKGLCSRCGKNLNEGNCSCGKDETDVRWLPLMELKNKLNTN